MSRQRLKSASFTSRRSCSQMNNKTAWDLFVAALVQAKVAAVK
jgi:hypothetical protein